MGSCWQRLEGLQPHRSATLCRWIVPTSRDHTYAAMKLTVRHARTCLVSQWSSLHCAAISLPSGGLPDPQSVLLLTRAPALMPDPNSSPSVLSSAVPVTEATPDHETPVHANGNDAGEEASPVPQWLAPATLAASEPEPVAQESQRSTVNVEPVPRPPDEVSLSHEAEEVLVAGARASALAQAPRLGSEPVAADLGPFRSVLNPLQVISSSDLKPRGLIRILKDKIFIITVVVPTLISAWFYGFIASDLYVSESRFVVRTPQRAQQPSLMGALLQGTGFMRSQDDAFTVHDYILSRDALRELDAKLKLRTEYSAESVDFVNRFPGPFGDDSFESLFKYYTRHAIVEHDSNSSITTLRVSAYSPEMAMQINTNLLAMGEQLVNKINERGRQDLIQYAATEVSDAETKAKAAALALANYRNNRVIFDPERQSAMQLQQVSKIQDELIATKIQLAQVQALSPQNPQIVTLKNRADGLEREMSKEMAKVAGGGNSFSNKAAEFERLSLERSFADRQVASALTSLENARNEARRKQLYLERIVQPSLPDYALEPRRFRNVVATLVLGLIAWGIAGMLIAGVKEHQA